MKHLYEVTTTVESMVGRLSHSTEIATRQVVARSHEDAFGIAIEAEREFQLTKKDRHVLPKVTKVKRDKWVWPWRKRGVA